MPFCSAPTTSIPSWADGWSCQHVLGAVSNIVLDSDACGYHITGEGNQIDDKMTANIPK